MSTLKFNWYKFYSEEVTLKIIGLSYARNNVKKVAEKLGIRSELLYKWSTSFESYSTKS